VVRHQGNPAARRLLAEVFEPVTMAWRGLGPIPAGGLALRGAYAQLEASQRFGLAPVGAVGNGAMGNGAKLQGEGVNGAMVHRQNASVGLESAIPLNRDPVSGAPVNGDPANGGPQNGDPVDGGVGSGGLRNAALASAGLEGGAGCSPDAGCGGSLPGVDDGAAVDGVCLAAAVLRGRLRPPDCPSFGRRCRPEHPLGAPMVSSEGACAAYWQYRR
jgi:hypothetical protein